MEEKKKEEKNHLLVSFIILALVMIAMATMITIQNNTINELKSDGLLKHPTVLTVPNSWGVYSDDESLTYFDGYVYNFGSEQATNLEMVCVFNDLADNELGEIYEDISNIASESYVYYSFEKDTPEFYSPGQTTADCHIKSCSTNCTILDEVIN